MNPGEIAERLISAAEIDRNSIGPTGPRKPKSLNLPIVHTYADKAGWGAERLAEERKEFWNSLAKRPSARQVSEAEEAWGWLALVPVEDERAALSAWVWCQVDSRRFFKDWCRKNGIHPETGRRRKNRALFCISAHLGGNMLQHCKNGDLDGLHDGPCIDEYGVNIAASVDEIESRTWWRSDFRLINNPELQDFSWAEARNKRRREAYARRQKKLAQTG